MRPHPKRARVNTQSPRAWGTCDRCGFITNLEMLIWQYEWRGSQLNNTHILVCSDCLDKPQRQLGTIFLQPDPVGVMNARPEPYAMEEITHRFTQDGTQRLQMDGQQRFTSNLQDTLALTNDDLTALLTDGSGNQLVNQ